MRISPYHPEHFDRLVAFLQANWAPRHAVYDRALFDWQYRIVDGPNESRVVLEGEAIVGFLGVIPGQYQLREEVVAGAGLAMWCVDERYRNGGLGILLLKEVEKRHRVVVCLGINPRVLPMYQRLGYSTLPRLHRYVAPLDERYSQLLIQPCDQAEVKPWIRSVMTSQETDLQHASPSQLAAITRPGHRLSLVRDASFYTWRYAQSAGFKYHLLTDSRGNGAVVRIEPVIAPENPEVHALRTLRIIELLPAGEISGLNQLIPSLLAWGSQHGCVAADFQCSSSQCGSTLTELGFRNQSTDLSPIASLAQLFQPWRPAAAPINCVWKVLDSNSRPVPIDADDTLFLKSDCDMDRPNLLAASPGGPMLTIVMYHYVRELARSRYPAIKGLDLPLFIQQLDHIQQNYTLVTMEQVIAAYSHGECLPPNAILLTFDDGYADHYQHVFPILRQRAIQGSFFPPAQAVLDGVVLDVNKIHHILASAGEVGTIAQTILDRVDKHRAEFSLESNDVYRHRYARPNRFDPAEVIFIKRMLQVGLPEPLRARITQQLFQKYVTTNERSFARELYMSLDQLREMHRAGMHIGSHTCSHRWLDTLDQEQQAHEVDLSLQFLRQIRGDVENWTICYPYGAWNESLLTLLRSRNCRLGLTTRVAIARPDETPLLLPRLDCNDLPPVSQQASGPRPAQRLIAAR